MKSLIILLFVFVFVSNVNGWAQKDTVFIKNMKDYKEGYINVLVSPSGRKSVVTIVDGEWQSGDKNMAAEGIGGRIVFSTETDTLPTIKWVEIDSFTTLYFEFIVTDSTGWVAKRDSAGKWHIKDCKRALEIMYDGLLYDRRQKEEEDSPLKIKLHNQEIKQ